MRERRWFWAIAAVAAVGAAALMARWSPGARRPPAPSAAEEPTPGPAEGSSTSEGPEPAAPTSRSGGPPAPVSAAAPAGCPEDEPDPPGFVRPSVWELVRTRNAELRDRLPQLSRDASPALREGLNGLSADDPSAAIDRLLEAPDRDRDGFDVAVAGLLNVTSRALARRRLDAAWRRASLGAREAPGDALTQALAALVARERGASRTALEHARRAYDAAPDEPAIMLLFARLAADGGAFGEAERAIDAYLGEVPDDRRIRTWRDRVALRRSLTATHASRSWDGIEVSWPDGRQGPGQIDDVMTAVDEAMRAMARVTGAQRRPELTVLIYDDRDALRRATCSPEWTGAIYDGALHLDLSRLAEPGWERTVRHEATHAQLALTRGRLPFWLNEGVAQWLEGDLTPQKRRRLARLAERDVWIPFASLEGPFLVIDDPRDAGFAYDQSLAMVMWLVEREGQRAISEALALVEAGESEDLLSRLSPGADGAGLLAYLRELSGRGSR